MLMIDLTPGVLFKWGAFPNFNDQVHPILWNRSQRFLDPKFAH